MRCTVLTLFPEMFAGPFDSSIIGRARAKKILTTSFLNIRDFAVDDRGSVDDRPYGGGGGMILRVDVLEPAIAAAKKSYRTRSVRTILLDPKGIPFTQTKADQLARFAHLIFVCGHYEGIDERTRAYVDESLSLGDFILTGGEIAAMAVIDAVARLLPGTLRDEQTAAEESFTLADTQKKRLLEYPHYTTPRDYKGQTVPEILLSGNHKQIREWRLQQSADHTKKYRPDLLGTKS